MFNALSIAVVQSNVFPFQLSGHGHFSKPGHKMQMKGLDMTSNYTQSPITVLKVTNYM